MKKKILGMAMGLMVLLGSSLCVCAEEQTPQAQNYQPIMTPEILASFETNVEDMDDTVFVNALVRRTDVWGSLQDADGDGIDDRDPINGCGYLDVNCNGFDDRFEMSAISQFTQENAQDGVVMQTAFNLFSHRCKHGVLYSDFVYDDDLCTYWSMPDYFDKCNECADSFDDMIADLFAIVDM
ncbi:MAG: hypothetical protein HFI91_14855 [Lachnospiraceae bacterium]|jgi:hypothetical protein|nr:hypothetical protein [Lachnospiraceae bacterium]